MVLALSYSIFALAYLEYLHLMNLSQLVCCMFVYIDNNLYINICIIGNQGLYYIAINFELSIFAMSFYSSNSIFGTSDTNRVNKISMSFIVVILILDFGFFF